MIPPFPRFRTSHRIRRLPLATLLLFATAAVPAAAQQTMTPSGGDKSIPDLAPRDPGHTGALHDRGKRETDVVEGIDRRLMNEEKDRPSLPNQAPSPSQNLPGGTGSTRPPQ